MNTDDSNSKVVDAAESPHHSADIVGEKLNDAQTPGFVAEFDPDEAERAGAFSEDALGESDAVDAALEMPMGLSAPAK